MEYDKRAIRHRIREAREKASLTQEELAEACSISVSHVSHIESGDRNPSVEVLVRICNATHTSPQYILQDSLGHNELDALYSLSERTKEFDVFELEMLNDVADTINKYSYDRRTQPETNPNT